jgi:hypothetical protein
MSRAFSCLFKSCKVGIDASHIAKFNNYCSSKDLMDFFSVLYNSQQQAAVLNWNQFVEYVTMFFNMGFVGIHEDLATGAGSVVMDLLLKFRLLKYNDNKTRELAENVRTQQLYSFGDRKSNENCLAFLSKLSHRPLTFEESSMQADVFLESFCNIMFLPGDWHTGMNMLQAIYRVFWVDILNPMKTFLSWKTYLTRC